MAKVQKSQKLVGEDEILAAKMYYDGALQREIQEYFGLKSRVPVMTALRRQGVTMRDPNIRLHKYSVNENVFDVIDSEEKAYWLGFLWGDGNTTSKELRLTLSQDDKPHIEKFASFIGSDAPIKLATHRGFGGGEKPRCVITINSVHLVRRLNELTVVVNRKKDNVTPFIPDDFARHWIRGLIDADGSISYKPYIQLCSSKNVAQLINSYIVDFFRATNPSVPPPNVQLQPTKCEYVFDLRYAGPRQASVILKYLYGDATVYLARKKHRSDYILAKREQRGL